MFLFYFLHILLDECIPLIISFCVSRRSPSRQRGGVGRSSGGSRGHRGGFRLRDGIVVIAGGYTVRSSLTFVKYHVPVVHHVCNHSHLAVIVFLHFSIKICFICLMLVVLILLFKWSINQYIRRFRIYVPLHLTFFFIIAYCYRFWCNKKMVCNFLK